MPFGAGALADQKQFPAAAAAVINALWAALDHEEHCKYILQGRHLTQLTLFQISEGQKVTHGFSLRNVIQGLSHNVAAQLTAAACQVHLCLVEIHMQTSRGMLPYAKTGSYCKAVMAAEILDDVFKAVLTGLKVTAHPLSTSSSKWQYACICPEHNRAAAAVMLKGVADGEPQLHQSVASIASTLSFACWYYQMYTGMIEGVHDKNHDVAQHVAQQMHCKTKWLGTMCCGRQEMLTYNMPSVWSRRSHCHGQLSTVWP